jgi:ParB family chromosome partitioning protein
MKANAPKRRVFADALDLLTDTVEPVGGTAMIPVDAVVPFRDHPFRLYEGERLQDMVESVRAHGILNPVIVRKLEDGYEMLAGHNRMNAARLAGIAEIPAIVKDNLSDEDAYVYVIETNLMQRSFAELLPSEKAAVLAERYDKILYQRNRDDIIKELKELEGDTKGGHDVHLSKNRDGLGEEYGLSGRSVARLLRVNELVPELKDKLDAGELNLVTAVQLSYVPEEVQRAAAALDKPVSKDMALKLREEGVTADDVKDIVCGAEKKRKPSGKSVRISSEVYEKYLKDAGEGAAEIIEQALTAWFERKEEAVV